MALQVKTILQRGPNVEDLPRREVRRFELEENVIGSFDYLRSKIVSLYPDLTDETPFRLLWTDEDGDNVCFSSDEEFTQAVSFFKNQEVQLAKILIKPLHRVASGNNPPTNAVPDGAGNTAGGGTSANGETIDAKAGACCSGLGGGVGVAAVPLIGEQNWNQFNKQISNRMEKVKNKCNKNFNHFQILEHVQQHAAQMAQNIAMGAVGALTGGGGTNGATPMGQNPQMSQHAQQMGQLAQQMGQHAQQMGQHAQQMGQHQQQHNAHHEQHQTAHNNATKGAKVTNMHVDPNGDMEIHVDIPIHHGNGTTTTGSTTTTRTTTGKNGSLYPDLTGNGTASATATIFKQTTGNGIDSEWTENITDEIQEAKMNEGLAKMKELGFEGNWVRELLTTVKCDITKAIEILNPTTPTEPQLD